MGNELLETVQTIGIVILGVFVVLGLSIVLVFRMIKRERIKEGKKKFGEDEFLFMDIFPILAGLPLPKGVKCSVYCLKSRLVIEANGQQFSLPVERLVDVSSMSKTQLQKQFVSDAGGAVAGGMVFGPLGAMLGGGIQEKTIRNTSKFLIFTYMDADGEQTKYIVFDLTDKTSSMDFESHFDYLKQREKKKIDL